MQDIYLVQQYKCSDPHCLVGYHWEWETIHVVHTQEKARKKASKAHKEALKALDNMADRTNALFSASIRIVLVIHNWI